MITKKEVHIYMYMENKHERSTNERADNRKNILDLNRRT